MKLKPLLVGVVGTALSASVVVGIARLKAQEAPTAEADFDELFQTMVENRGERYVKARDQLLTIRASVRARLSGIAESSPDGVARAVAEACLGWFENRELYQRAWDVDPYVSTAQHAYQSLKQQLGTRELAAMGKKLTPFLVEVALKTWPCLPRVRRWYILAALDSLAGFRDRRAVSGLIVFLDEFESIESRVPFVFSSFGSEAMDSAVGGLALAGGDEAFQYVGKQLRARSKAGQIAIRRLNAEQKRALAGLIEKGLEAGDPSVRRNVALALASITERPLLEELCEVLANDPRPDCREAAVRLLEPRATAEVTPAAIGGLSDEVAAVRGGCCRILSALGDKRAAGALSEVALADSSEAVQREAIDALGKLGDPSAFDPLLRLLSSPSSTYRVRHGAYEALFSLAKSLDADAVARVTEVAEEAQGRVRGYALSLLAQCAPNVAVPMLIRTLTEGNDRSARDMAIAPLIETKEPRAVQAVIGFLGRDASEQNKRCAAMVFARSGSKEGVPSIVAMLSSSDMQTRACAVDALGVLGDPRAVEPLAAAMAADKQERVRKQAAFALGRIGDPRAIPALRKVALAGKGQFVRQAAIHALGRIKDPASSTFLRSLAISNGPAELRRGACYALRELADVAAIPYLMEAARDPAVTRAAVYAVYGLAGEEGNQYLRQTLTRHYSEAVWLKAIQLIGAIGTPDVIADLRARTESHKNPEIRKKAEEAIQSILERAKQAQKRKSPQQRSGTGDAK